VASGSGEQIVHFARHLPGLIFQPSDPDAEALRSIRAWVLYAGVTNVLPPLLIDASREQTWPATRFDAVFTANTLHIMGWPDVESLFAALPRVLAPDATLVVYGPFNIGGRFTAPSNAAFDASLRADDPRRGIRDLEAVQALAAQAGLAFVADLGMPANNRCLVWTTA
jgi:hypothetical protein